MKLMNSPSSKSVLRKICSNTALMLSSAQMFHWHDVLMFSWHCTTFYSVKNTNFYSIVFWKRNNIIGCMLSNPWWIHLKQVLEFRTSLIKFCATYYLPLLAISLTIKSLCPKTYYCNKNMLDLANIVLWQGCYIDKRWITSAAYALLALSCFDMM